MINIWQDRNWSPMLLKEIDKPFNSKDYIFELKFDGIRAIIFVSPKGIKIQSRNKQDMTYLFPELRTIKSVVKKNIIFDGEIVAFENNKPAFSKVQQRLHLKDKKKIEIMAANTPITFVVFDILYENKDLTTLSLIKRKEYLNKYEDSDIFIKTKTIDKDGVKLFQSVKRLGLEGIVAKNKNSTYHINKRTDDFIKIKNIQRDEFYIGGYEIKKNGILSLAVGEYIDNKFHYAGKVSIGKKVSIYNQVKAQKESKNYFCDFDEDITYIKPSMSCHIAYLERTSSNHLRQPIFKDI